MKKLVTAILAIVFCANIFAQSNEDFSMNYHYQFASIEQQMQFYLSESFTLKLQDTIAPKVKLGKGGTPIVVKNNKSFTLEFPDGVKGMVDHWEADSSMVWIKFDLKKKTVATLPFLRGKSNSNSFNLALDYLNTKIITTGTANKNALTLGSKIYIAEGNPESLKNIHLVIHPKFTGKNKSVVEKANGVKAK